MNRTVRHVPHGLEYALAAEDGAEAVFKLTAKWAAVVWPDGETEACQGEELRLIWSAFGDDEVIWTELARVLERAANPPEPVDRSELNTEFIARAREAAREMLEEGYFQGSDDEAN